MKSEFCYRLNISGPGDQLSKIELDSTELAQTFYNEKLGELRNTGEPFTISMKLVYTIEDMDVDLGTSDKTTAALDRYYFIAAHNEKGPTCEELISDNLNTLKEHVKNGFFSDYSNAFNLTALSKLHWGFTALALSNGAVVGYMI